MAVKDIFPRLYLLSSRKNSIVKEMGEWVEGRWVRKLGWRTLLERERTREVELIDFINNFPVLDGVDDRRLWGKERNGSYSVHEAYESMSVVGSYPLETSLTCTVFGRRLRR